MTRAVEQSVRGMRHLALSAVVLPIVLAVISSAWFVWQIRRMAEAAAWIDSSDRVIALAVDAQRLIVDQEMALSRYLFTQDPGSLESFRQGSPDADLDELEGLLAFDPAQAADVHWLRELYGGWRRRAAEAIAGPIEGRSSAGFRDRWAAIAEMRATSTGVVEREKRTRLARTRGFEGQTRATTIGAVIVLALLAAASSISSRRRLKLIGALMAREGEALGKAQEALRAKDAFLATLSHELRTPLTPILGWVTIARTRHLEGEALERALASIERNARAESRIVDDVLDIGRITSGNMRISQEPVDPAAVVRAAIDVVDLSARAKGITLGATIASPLPSVLGDPGRLQQIVWNLLSNAVKFTPQGGRVDVRVDGDDRAVRIRVADSGAGIPAEFMPHVFEYFRQADASTTRAHGGLGLGLAIVRHLVELHGGEVHAESEGPGHGAIFTVELPTARAPLN
jgi:signal transduction histidine kinase